MYWSAMLIFLLELETESLLGLALILIFTRNSLAHLVYDNSIHNSRAGFKIVRQFLNVILQKILLFQACVDSTPITFQALVTMLESVIMELLMSTQMIMVLPLSFQQLELT